MNIFFTADTHYGHKNIVEGVSEWEDKSACRKFDTLEEHNDKLTENINKRIKKDDILYHLGDWSFGGIDNIYEFRKRIYCKTIHLILGNHDHHIENNKVLPNERSGWDIGCPTLAKEMFASVDKYIIKKIAGQNMMLCHYSMRTWDRGAHGTWMLYGHSHNTLSEYISDSKDDNGSMGYYKTMDVGIDTHKEFRPYHFDEIAEVMKDRVNLKVDHHNANTK